MMCYIDTKVYERKRIILNNMEQNREKRQGIRKMSGIKRETIIRVILGICMIVVSIGMIQGKSKAGNANGNDRTYIEESEKNAKQKKAEKSENDSTGSAKQDSTVKTKMTEQRQVSGTEAKAIAEAEAIEASIQPGQYPVMGISSIRAWQLVNYFKAYGSTYPAEVLTQGGAPDIETFAQAEGLTAHANSIAVRFEEE